MKTIAPPATGSVVFGRTAAEAAKLSHAQQRGDVVEWTVFWVFVAGLAWLPSLYGGNDLRAWGINAVLFPGLAVTYEASILVRRQPHPVGIAEIWIPSGLFIIVVCWIVVQGATWTPASWHHPAWGMTGDALDKAVQGSISVNRDLTALALLRLVTAASVFWLALQLCRNAVRANYLVTTLAAMACGYALYGIMSVTWTPGQNAYVTSTFVNRNSFATYAGIGLVACCGLVVRHYRREIMATGGTARYRISTFIEATEKQGALLLAGVLTSLVAVFLTGSLGAFIATGFGLFVLAVLLFGSRHSSPSGQRIAIYVGVTVVAAAFLAFGDLVAGKIAQRGLSDASRLAIYKITLVSILDSPFLGYGYGTFMDVFPMFRDRSVAVDGVWEQAHNTYLEIFQGLGLIFGSTLVVSVALFVLKCLKGATTRQESVTVPVVATSAALLVGVHTLVDFSLQIQAVALTFMAILGAGVAQSESSRRALGD
jgi:O-antigen ligase